MQHKQYYFLLGALRVKEMLVYFLKYFYKMIFLKPNFN